MESFIKNGGLTTSVRRTEYPYRKIRVVLRTTERRENKRATALREQNDFALRASNREISRGYLRRDLKRKQTTFTIERINERSAGPLSRPSERNVTFRTRRHRGMLALSAMTFAEIKRDAVTSRYLMKHILESLGLRHHGGEEIWWNLRHEGPIFRDTALVLWHNYKYRTDGGREKERKMC